MASTKNKPFNGTNTNFRGIVVNQPWSLCVGAGISVGMVPTWNELTRRVLNDAFDTNYDSKAFDAQTDNT